MKFIKQNMFWLALIALFAIGIGFLAITDPSKDNNQTTNNSATENTSANSTPTEDALYLSKATEEKVVLVEYSDFQCPACAGMYGLLNQAKAEFGDSVSFEFRHFPLTSIHPNAMTAHRIAQAAKNQDLFTEVHNTLFDNTTIWTEASQPSQAIFSLLESTLPAIDIDKLRTDADDSASLAAINEDIQSGKQLGVEGTPSLFINNTEISITSYESLQSQLQAAIDSAAVASGE